MLWVVRELLRRAWAAPLAAHAAVLAVLLVSLVPVIGTSASYSPDEGAVVHQVRSLAAGDGWILEHPWGELDPAHRFYPLGSSSQGEDGRAPFAKHPAYPLLLTAVQALGGVAAMTVVSVLGTVAAAVVGALVAREVSGGLERPVLWAVGVGSPLVFDAYLLIAHSLGAAVVSGAVLLALRGSRHTRLAPTMAGAALLVAAGVLFRSEALLFALALGSGVAATGLAWRRWALVAWGPVLGLAGLAAAAGERWAQEQLLGTGAGPVAAPRVEGSFVGARVEGFLNTWLRPSAGVPDTADLALLLAAVLVATAVAVARGRGATRLLVALSASAVGLSTYAFVADPGRIVPGLVVAFPLAVAAIGLVDRSYLEPGGRLLLSVTAGGFLAAVLATQYREGGSAEWGGRYFALAVPILAVLAVDALARRAPSLPSVARWWAGAGLVACSAVLAAGAVVALSQAHRFTDRLVARIGTTARATEPGDGDRRPVVVSAYPNIPRLAWTVLGEGRWAHAPRDSGAAELAGLLDGAGVAELVLVGQDAGDLAPYLSHYALDRSRSWEMGRWDVSVLVGAPRR